MTKSLFLLPILGSGLLLLSACASGPEASDYANLECDEMRALVEGQDYAASVRGVELYNDRGMEETRQESGSPWAGRERTRDETKLKEERSAMREAYRRKGCQR